jgi:hypothetical protein
MREGLCGEQEGRRRLRGEHAAGVVASFGGQVLRAVVEAAKKVPERYGKVAQDMDRTSSVDRAYKAVQSVQRQAAC